MTDYLDDLFYELNSQETDEMNNYAIYSYSSDDDFSLITQGDILNKVKIYIPNSNYKLPEPEYLTSMLDGTCLGLSSMACYGNFAQNTYESNPEKIIWFESEHKDLQWFIGALKHIDDCQNGHPSHLLQLTTSEKNLWNEVYGSDINQTYIKEKIASELKEFINIMLIMQNSQYGYNENILFLEDGSHMLQHEYFCTLLENLYNEKSEFYLEKTGFFNIYDRYNIENFLSGCEDKMVILGLPLHATSLIYSHEDAEWKLFDPNLMYVKYDDSNNYYALENFGYNYESAMDTGYDLVSDYSLNKQSIISIRVIDVKNDNSTESKILNHSYNNFYNYVSKAPVDDYLTTCTVVNNLCVLYAGSFFADDITFLDNSLQNFAGACCYNPELIFNCDNELYDVGILYDVTHSFALKLDQNIDGIYYDNLEAQISLLERTKEIFQEPANYYDKEEIEFIVNKLDDSISRLQKNDWDNYIWNTIYKYNSIAKSKIIGF